MVVIRDSASDVVIASAIDVHRELGPGLLESAYQTCLLYELMQRGLSVATEVPIPVRYREKSLDCGFRADMLVEGELIVEVKSVERLLPIHTAQVLTHLRLTGARQALLLNFGQLTLKAGLKSYLGHGNNGPIADR